MINSLTVDKLKVEIFDSRILMGEAAANEAANLITSLQKRKNELNLLFSSAPSQDEFLGALVSKSGINWKQINAFHLDEYIGISPDTDQSFCCYLRKSIAEKVNLKSVYYINGNNPDPLAECERYACLLGKYPIDIAFLGIGQNGHIAFNDPGIADFNDKKIVKIVEELEEEARLQQVIEGHFDKMEDVPKRAITVTIPGIVSADYIIAIVPGAYKAEIVKKVLTESINEQYPATIIRNHKKAVLFLDRESASKINMTK